jgi:TonB family protein
VIYLLGLVMLGARLLAGVMIARRIVKRASRVSLDAGRSAFESEQVRVPLTAGYLAPRILLPVEWRNWDDAKREAVLSHEGAHVARRDGLVNLIAAFNACVFWFHPLAWWLERRLAVLAEHAADDIAMDSCGDSQRYAKILLSIAAPLGAYKNRLMWGGVSMQGGRLAERIHRVLAFEHSVARLGRWSAALVWSGAAAVVWLAGTLQFQSVARAQTPFVQVPPTFRLTPAEAAELEQQRSDNPDDEKVTQKLLGYYFFNHRAQERVELVFWMVDHHPEWQLNNTVFGKLLDLNSSSDHLNWELIHQGLRSRWTLQAARHPEDARVLGNAAYALDDGDGAMAMEYLQRAQRIDPANWTAPLARYYAQALTWNGDGSRFPGNAQLREQVLTMLNTASDAELILATVEQMVQWAGQSALGGRGPGVDLAQVRSRALALLGRVEQLRPGSQAVVELMEGVRQLGSTLMPADTGGDKPAVIRVGGNVQAANLIASVAPLYPVEAKARGIEGLVKLQVRINVDGRVDSAAVISSDPALADAAIDAVKQYVYKPTMLNGKPCVVLTTVDVVFRLNGQ